MSPPFLKDGAVRSWEAQGVGSPGAWSGTSEVWDVPVSQPRTMLRTEHRCVRALAETTLCGGLTPGPGGQPLWTFLLRCRCCSLVTQTRSLTHAVWESISLHFKSLSEAYVSQMKLYNRRNCILV